MYLVLLNYNCFLYFCTTDSYTASFTVTFVHKIGYVVTAHFLQVLLLFKYKDK